MDDARVLSAERSQLQLRPFDLDALVPDDHRARAIWQLVEALDLSRFYAPIQARGSTAGRPAVDPKILLTLWVFATSEGVGSARQLSRLCEDCAPYEWICGGVSVSYHTLSDFRVAHSDDLDELMTQLLAVLMKQKLITLETVAQDGLKVRASAGSGSFRTRGTLKRFRNEARARIRKLKAELDTDPAASDARRRAAQERAAAERKAKVDRALEAMKEAERIKDKVNKKHKERKPQQARTSVTDSDARVMKMPNGGFRPAYNVQLGTETKNRFIVGVDVSTTGSDMALMPPMLAQIEGRCRRPTSYLVDGGFASFDALKYASDRNVEVLAPSFAAKDRKPRSEPAFVKAWRERMDRTEVQLRYRERAAVAETVNADLRHWRGLRQFNVRGVAKVKAVTRLFALTYNLLRCITLGCQLMMQQA